MLRPALLAACLLLAVPAASADHTDRIWGNLQEPDDLDRDRTPDVAEQVVCGPAIARTALEFTNLAGCTAPDDLWVKHTDTLWGIVDQQREAAEDEAHDLLAPHDDGDGDRVPDSVEPWLCQVENSNFPEDGTCDETLTDYTPPA